MESKACDFLFPNGLHLLRPFSEMLLFDCLIWSLNHGTCTAGNIGTSTIDSVLIQQMGVTIEIQVKTMLGHRCHKILHVHFVRWMVANNDQPVLFWHFAQFLREPLKLSTAVLRQDVFMKFAGPLGNWSTGRKL